MFYKKIRLNEQFSICISFVIKENSIMLTWQRVTRVYQWLVRWVDISMDVWPLYVYWLVWRYSVYLRRRVSINYLSLSKSSFIKPFPKKVKIFFYDIIIVFFERAFFSIDLVCKIMREKEKRPRLTHIWDGLYAIVHLLSLCWIFFLFFTLRFFYIAFFFSVTGCSVCTSWRCDNWNKLYVVCVQVEGEK